MKNIRISFVLAALLAASSVAQADSSVRVTEAKLKGSRALGLDIVTDGTVSAFQFFVKVNGGSVNTSKCLSGLNKTTHTGGCVFKDGELRVAVFSPSAATLPAGPLNLGSVVVSGTKGAVQGDLEVTNVEFSNAKGEVQSSSVEVSRENAK